MKQNLFLDLDGVVFNTVKAIVTLYNNDFCRYKDFKPVNWFEVDSWNFDECKLATPEYKNIYFNQPRFFEELEWMPGAEDVIMTLQDQYDISFVTKGEYANLELKREWQDTFFPDCGFYGIDLYQADKSIVDMNGGIFLDDCSNNLRTSNAEKKYCFGQELNWNRDWEGKRLVTWTDVYRELWKK